MSTCKLPDLKIGQKLKRKDTGEIVLIENIIKENDDYKIYTFWGFGVNKKIMLKFFENDNFGNFYIQ